MTQTRSRATAPAGHCQRFGLTRIFLLGLTLLLTVSGAGSSVCLAQPGQPAQADLPTQMHGSVGRLQTFEDTTFRDIRTDPQRDKDIQQLLPNYRVLQEGSSDRGLKRAGLEKLASVQLTSSGRKTADMVAADVSIYRRLPQIRFEMDPDTYDYFIGQPDVIVSLWKALGISAIELDCVKQYHYRLKNSDGTASNLYYIRRSKTENIIYCDGEFVSPLLKKPISAKCIFCLYASFEQQADGSTFVNHYADVFVSFPSGAIEAAAKLISPVSNYIADRNFQEISLFMHTMSLTMSRQPGWVAQQAERMQGVPDEQKQQLIKLTHQNYALDQQRMATRWNELTAPPM